MSATRAFTLPSLSTGGGDVPLERRLEFAAGSPVGIAEMVVDLGVGRSAIARFELLPRASSKRPSAEIGPAEAVDDVAVVRASASTAFSIMSQRRLEVHALIDPAIAEIVQHLRLVRIELERSA